MSFARYLPFRFSGLAGIGTAFVIATNAGSILSSIGIAQNDYELAQNLVSATFIKNDPSLNKYRSVLNQTTYRYLLSESASQCEDWVYGTHACSVSPEKVDDLSKYMVMVNIIMHDPKSREKLDSFYVSKNGSKADSPKVPGL